MEEGGRDIGVKCVLFNQLVEKQVKSAVTVVQGYFGGLLRLGGDPEGCFVSKSVREWLCEKGNLGEGS